MISFKTALEITIWIYKHLDIFFIAAGVLFLVIPNSGMSTWACIGYIALGVVVRVIKILWKKRNR